MPFVTSKMINQAYYQNEMNIFLIYGPLGIGKSSYALKVGAEILGSFDRIKKFIVFHPKDFVERCISMSETGRREKLIIWDDAGYWLFYMDYTDPFVKAVMKYLNVARTNWGGMIFTTPSPTYIVHKTRNFPQNISIKIIKEGSDQKNPKRPRIAKAYRSWVAPDFRHQGVRLIYADKFNAILPKDFFEWYNPIRSEYAKQAGLNMRQELTALKNKGKKDLEQAVENILDN